MYTAFGIPPATCLMMTETTETNLCFVAGITSTTYPAMCDSSGTEPTSKRCPWHTVTLLPLSISQLFDLHLALALSHAHTPRRSQSCSHSISLVYSRSPTYVSLTQPLTLWVAHSALTRSRLRTQFALCVRCLQQGQILSAAGMVGSSYLIACEHLNFIALDLNNKICGPMVSLHTASLIIPVYSSSQVHSVTHCVHSILANCSVSSKHISDESCLCRSMV